MMVMFISTTMMMWVGMMRPGGDAVRNMEYVGDQKENVQVKSSLTLYKSVIMYSLKMEIPVSLKRVSSCSFSTKAVRQRDVH
jgi:hypothetical protein